MLILCDLNSPFFKNIIISLVIIIFILWTFYSSLELWLWSEFLFRLVCLQEMKLLSEVDQPGSLIENYVGRLNFVLSRKVAGLVSLQARMARFQHRLKEQEILSRKRVPRLFWNWCNVVWISHDNLLSLTHLGNSVISSLCRCAFILLQWTLKCFPPRWYPSISIQRL